MRKDLTTAATLSLAIRTINDTLRIGLTDPQRACMKDMFNKLHGSDNTSFHYTQEFGKSHS